MPSATSTCCRCTITFPARCFVFYREPHTFRMRTAKSGFLKFSTTFLTIHHAEQLRLSCLNSTAGLMLAVQTLVSGPACRRHGLSPIFIKSFFSAGFLVPLSPSSTTGLAQRHLLAGFGSGGGMRGLTMGVAEGISISLYLVFVSK